MNRSMPTFFSSPRRKTKLPITSLAPFKIIPRKKLFRLPLSKQQSNFLCILLHSILRYLFLVVIVILFYALYWYKMYDWLERSFKFFMEKLIPLDIVQPGMVFDLLYAVTSQSLSRVTQQQLNKEYFTLFIKSIECGDHLKGSWSTLTPACLDIICYLISFLFAPM